MYKVVIIDDEPIIVKGLSKMVLWEKYGCKVVGTAEDGQEGLELIRRIRPDIVFSDIYMPRMNGLLMAAALKSEFEDMELAILTGYRDFELVQEALHIGVTRFILKPSSMEELEEAVKAMTEKLRKKGLYGEAEDAAEAEPQVNTPAGSFIVKNALAFIRANYNRKITLKEVADSAYVSQWHLSKLLNRHTGQSFSEILNTARIEAAKELLRDPSLRIGEIAEQVGFLDLPHFSRVFKKVTGVSANEYRNQLR